MAQCGIVHQETRGIYYKGDKILSNALNEFFKVDPVPFVIGICGPFLCANKKRYRTRIMGYSIFDIFVFCSVDNILSFTDNNACILYCSCTRK